MPTTLKKYCEQQRRIINAFESSWHAAATAEPERFAKILPSPEHWDKIFLMWMAANVQAEKENKQNISNN